MAVAAKSVAAGAKKTAAKSSTTRKVTGKKAGRPRTAPYESIVGSAFLYPVFDLLAGLEKIPSASKVNQVQSAPMVHGYAASIIVLTVIWLESAIAISKLIAKSDVKSVRVYFAKQFPNSPLQDTLTELFAIRDVIAHSHIWKGKVFFMGMKWTKKQPELLPSYGDKSYFAVVDKKTRTTKTLGLQVIPTKLSLIDVRRVLTAASAVVRELRDWHMKQDRVLISAGVNHHFVFRGAYTAFWDVIETLEEEQKP